MKLSKLLVAVMACLFVLNFVSPLMAADPVTIEGTVEKVEGGFVIQAADADYKVAGVDVAAMVGKKVKATGTVAEEAGAKTITATAVEEVK